MAATFIAARPRPRTSPTASARRKLSCRHDWGDLFEASRTYSLKGSTQYLTISSMVAPMATAISGLPCRQPGWRVDSCHRRQQLRRAVPWRRQRDLCYRRHPWTDDFSHGEIIRTGYDETSRSTPTICNSCIRETTPQRTPPPTVRFLGNSAGDRDHFPCRAGS